MKDKPARDPRVIALRNFAISITGLNIAGFTFLGFEQPWVWPLIAVATGYATELLLEVVGSRAEGRPARFRGNGPRGLMEFLYPAHITSLAVNMLIYVNDRVLVMVFAVMVAICGKWLLRVPVAGGRMRHFMNPSNFGIVAILLLFPWVSVAPPYHFSEHVNGVVDWIIPVAIIVAGTMLNGLLTKRMWLIGAWLAAFALQAVVRGVLLDTSILAALATMTGIAFVLYTNYMIPDPGTTPWRPLSQVAFGAGAALYYAVFTGMGIAYGLFFATVCVCLTRGGFLWSLHIVRRAQQQREAERPTAPREPATGPVDGVRPTVSVAPPPDREVVRA